MLRPGDSLSGKIDDGLKRSEFGVLVLSKSFFAKRWPESEYRALLALGRRLIPVWHEVDHEDVARFSPLLSDLFAIRADLGVESAALQLINVIRPDLIEAVGAEVPESENGRFEDYDLAPYRTGGEGVPTDALPWQPFAANVQPCLDARFGEPNRISYQSAARWAMQCSVINLGAGAARAGRLFLPYLDVCEIDVLQPREERDIRIFLDDRFAFCNYVRSPMQTVFEYEDISGFLYRQYGSIDQTPVPDQAFYRFTLRAIGKPYRVKERIVSAESPTGWLQGTPQ